MSAFTFVPVWVAQDVIVYLLAIAVMVHIARHEQRAASILMEWVCFVFLYAAVFENFATQMGWYGYGRSLLMIFHVPVSVPVMEYMVVYAALKLAGSMNMPVWGRPVFVGAFGILADLSLDPLAVSQRYATLEGEIGRWTWFPASTDIQLFGIPVYNYTGWFVLCGFAAVFLLLGRAWYRHGGYKSWVGLAYPPIALLMSLVALMSPLSSFVLWLWPAFDKGGVSEAIMLALALTAFAVVLFMWRGRMREPLSARTHWPLWLVFAALHLSNLIFAVIGGHWLILAQTAPAAAGHLMVIACIFKKGRAQRVAVGGITG